MEPKDHNLGNEDLRIDSRSLMNQFYNKIEEKIELDEKSDEEDEG